MAHFAKLDDNNKVLTVIVVSDSDAPTEAAGQSYLQNIFGWDANKWKQTSYNGNFRGKYAGIGDKYDADLDEFVSPVVEEDSAE